MGLTISYEKPEDAAAIARIHDAAFGGTDESRLVAALRRDGDLVLSLVAVHEDKAIGHVAFSRIVIDGGAPERAVALAPVAVLPEYQGQGVGHDLIEGGLLMLTGFPETLVFVLGDPTYYGRFGFDAKLAEAWTTPWPGEAFQAKWLGVPEPSPGGVLRYAPAFSAFEE